VVTRCLWLNGTVGLRWHVDRAPTLAAILEASGPPMLDITNAGPPDDTAQTVIATVGWEPRSDS
jgi:hypothetical protein